jgi:hypothetical protein
MNSELATNNLRDPDGGIHLARKKAELGVIENVEAEVKTSFPTEGFNDSLDGLPLISFKAVWTYMVACMEAKQQLLTAKPLVNGFNVYKSSHAITVKSCTKQDTMRTYIKSLAFYEENIGLFMLHHSKKEWASAESMLWLSCRN